MFAPTKIPTSRRRGIRTAVIEVEKYGFAGVVDPCVEAVTVTMAISRRQIGEGFNRLCGPRRDGFKIAADVDVFHDAAIAYAGERPMQQVFEVEPIERSVRLEGLGRVVQQSKGLAVGPCIAGIRRIRLAALDRPEEHGLTHTLRRLSLDEQAALACWDGCCDRNARLREMRQESRFGLDVGQTASAAMRKPEHIPLAVACHGKIHIIQAAFAHGSVEFVKENIYSNYKDDIRNRCNSRKSPGVSEYYTSRSGYSGRDMNKVRVSYGEGTIKDVTVNINVIKN